MSALGYRECVSVVKGLLTEEQAKVEMRRVTRIFVRRQANWFKESDPNIMWFRVKDGVDKEVEAHIRQSLFMAREIASSGCRPPRNDIIKID